MNITIKVISDNIIELHFTEPLYSVKLRKFEQSSNIGEYNYIKYNCTHNIVPLRVNNSNDSIFIEITELNDNKISFGIFKIKDTKIDTIDTIDTFKLAALESMRKTIDSLTTEVARAQQYVERARSAELAQARANGLVSELTLPASPEGA